MFSGKLSFLNINHLQRTLSKVFIVCSAMLVVYILIKFFMIKQEISTQILGYPETSMTKTATRLVPKSAPFAEYLTNISGRDFFKLPKEKPPVCPVWPKYMTNTPPLAVCSPHF